MSAITAIQADAERLAHALPRLMLDARQCAASLVHGLHGRRRAGSGETFWQFRPFQSGEPAQRIDWRRSARDQRLSVKERELEAAQTIGLWADVSASMRYGSSLSPTRKDHRALVMLLALAEVLVEGGERVALIGLGRPSASRAIMARLGEALALNEPTLRREALPPAAPLPSRGEAVVFTDGLAPLDLMEERLRALSAQGARGHLVLVTDPAEEVFPFSGRVEFLAPEGRLRVVSGRAESWREAYGERLAERRAMLKRLTASLGWSLMLHRTDQPPAPALMMLHQRMGDRNGGRG